MKVYIRVYSGNNDRHMMQFTVNAIGLDSAVGKAKKVITVYHSGYGVNSIHASIRKSVHTSKCIQSCHMTVSKNVIGTIAVSMADSNNRYKEYLIFLDNR